jgi:hypothetical protein
MYSPQPRTQIITVKTHIHIVTNTIMKQTLHTYDIITCAVIEAFGDVQPPIGVKFSFPLFQISSNIPDLLGWKLIRELWEMSPSFEKCTRNRRQNGFSVFRGSVPEQ